MKLKRCPFSACGGEVTVDHFVEFGISYVRVICERCGTESERFIDGEGAEKKAFLWWNYRGDESRYVCPECRSDGYSVHYEDRIATIVCHSCNNKWEVEEKNV